MISRISYVYKYDDNTYWQVSGYYDNFGLFNATNYSFGIR